MPRPRRLTVLPLVAATFFMVSGGPYGLEELLASAGTGGALIAIAVIPFAWSLPTVLMVGELSAALPETGGYYAWVRRALGPFWGFQEAWLSLTASIFDMAIYPTIFASYLGRLIPQLSSPAAGIAAGVVLIAVCAAWNCLGAGAVGRGSIALGALLLAPFGVLVALAFAAPVSPGGAQHAAAAGVSGSGLVAGLLVAMWNFMGWDNASTVASEVERPQRTYPVAMLSCVALVAGAYLLPVLAVRRAGLDPSAWVTGSWTVAGGALGGRWLGLALGAGGLLCGAGMFNALILSYSRVPAALAEDGVLPRAFALRTARTGAPWVAIWACAAAYALCLGLGFRRLVQVDVLLYGLSLLLEFVALFVLRLREPDLPRPFRVPGGLPAAALLGVPVLALLGLAFVAGGEGDGTLRVALRLGCALIAAGPATYWLRGALSARKGPSLQ